MSARLSDHELAAFYLHAKESVIARGFADEVDWQFGRHPARVDDAEFLMELAWVIINSGFREAVARQVFPRIAEAFSHWRALDETVRQLVSCERRALRSFANPRKIRAIGHATRVVATKGAAYFMSRVEERGAAVLQEFPQIGPITSFHLAKNLGFAVCKPDRHLVRLSQACGWDKPSDLCDAVRELVGDPVSVVDVVLWRFAVEVPRVPPAALVH